jgi:hypothetical protein
VKRHRHGTATIGLFALKASLFGTLTFLALLLNPPPFVRAANCGPPAN